MLLPADKIAPAVRQDGHKSLQNNVALLSTALFSFPWSVSSFLHFSNNHTSELLNYYVKLSRLTESIRHASIHNYTEVV